MISQITRGIKISVITDFEGLYFRDGRNYFAFSYEITFHNQSKDTVQVVKRFWEVFDALNNKDIVAGEGVVGKKPIIKPGEHYTYRSGCLLISPYGSMKGFYSLINLSSSRSFKVNVPSFKFHAPYALN